MKVHCPHDRLVPIVELKFNPNNTNKHPPEQIDRLAKILEYQGWRYPIKVSKQSGFVTSGHGRAMAAMKLKWFEAPVSFQDYENEAQELADLTSDNAIASWAELDLSMVNVQLESLGPDFDIDLLGIKNFEIEVADKDLGDEDAVPEHVEPKTKLGDVYKLGNHRLMCGDSTSIDAVKKLMESVVPDLIYTDPPYGMNAVTKSGVLSKKYKTDIIGDDNPDVAKDCFRLAFGLYPESKHVWWGANYYSSALPDSECWIVWDKNNGKSIQTDAELAWSNFRSVVRQFTQSSEKKNRVHPTQKPVSLVDWVLERFNIKPKTIADFFAGSGSTLIASEKNGIKSYNMEFDPKFCDVIVARWEKYTGLKAELING